MGIKHFIVAIGYDDNGFIYANDPNKSEVPRKQHQDKFKKCLKKAFVFWPSEVKKITDETDATGEEVVSEPVDPVAPVAPEVEVEITADGKFVYSDDRVEYDKHIIDISYHKGSIDFDALKPHVSLVIPRASIGSDKDTRFDEYAKAMKERGIPFGVFCYSYCRDAAKGEDEAIKMVGYAAKYNPLFYAIDMEETCVTQAGVRAFVKTLRDLGIKRVGAYVAHHHYNDYRFDELRSLFDFVWIPRYKKNDDGLPTGTLPDYACDLWQYTEKGKIAGISTYVDMNVITGHGKTLEWFLEGADTEVKVEDTAAVQGRVQIHGGNVNVRTAPNTNSKILGVAYNGDVLEYGGEIDPASGWLSVKYLGQSAWVSNKYSRLI